MAFTLTQPLYGQGGSYTAQQDRLFIQATAVTQGVRKLTAASGGVMTGDLAVTTSGTTNGSVFVAAGAVVVASSTASQGHYFANNDGATLVGSFTANSSGNPRIDLVTVLITDTGATPVVSFAIVAGTPAATPSAPATPSNSLVLAQVAIPNGFTVTTTVAAGNITDVRQKAFVPDLSVTSTSATVIPSPTHGNMAYRSDDQRLNTYNANAVEGARWENVPERTGFRNAIINGKMDIAQRGTSVTGNTIGGYTTVDRFTLGLSSLGTWTITQTADAPTGTDFRNCYKVACTTANASPAAGAFMQLSHIIEGQDLQHFRKGTSSAKPFTLSFWTKSFQTGTFIVELLDLTNSRSVCASYTISASGTWQYVSLTFPADTTGALANDNSGALYINWWLGAGSTYTSGTLPSAWGALTSANRAVGQTNIASSTSNYWQVTGCQLEQGSVASPFERRPIGAELALCQRYYQKESDAGIVMGVDQNGTPSTGRYVGVQFPVTMRTNTYTASAQTAAGAGSIYKKSLSGMSVSRASSGTSLGVDLWSWIVDAEL